MKLDPGSNYEIAEALASDSYNAGAQNSVMIDHSKGHSGSFFLSCGDVGVAGTVDMKLQSSPDGTTWTDEPDTALGNDVAIIQLVAAGVAQLNVPNPRDRYSRVVVTVAVNACVLGVTSVLGPLRHIEAV